MNTIIKYLKKGELALFIIFLLVFVFFSFASEYFFSVRNIMNVSGQLSITLIASIGFAVLLIAGEVDISIGSLLAFVSLPLIEIMNITESVPLAIFVCLLFGIIIGFINGYLSVYLGISSLIVTLGMLFILRGTVYLYTGQRAISDDYMSDFFFYIGNGKFMGIVPYSAILALIILCIFLFVMHNTSYGRKLYAIGGNKEVAHLAGYNIKRLKYIVKILEMIKKKGIIRKYGFSIYNYNTTLASHKHSVYFQVRAWNHHIPKV